MQVERRLMGAVPAAAGPVFIAAAGSLPALCPFRVWSGHACPLCGMTRAVGSAVTGDLGTAVRYHPLVILLVLQVAVLGIMYRRTGSGPPPHTARWIFAANALTFTVVWLARWRYGLLDVVVS